MSIDGIIARVERENADIRIYLRSRPKGYFVGDGQWVNSTQPPGQDAFTIVGATWIPEVGMEAWGGGNSVEIVAEPRREYHRIGYGRLVENFTRAPGRDMDYWWQVGRHKGEPNPGVRGAE